MELVIQKNPENNVIPVYLDNVYKTLPRGKNLILPFNCSIKFGDPIVFKSMEMEDILLSSEKAMQNLMK